MGNQAQYCFLSVSIDREVNCYQRKNKSTEFFFWRCEGEFEVDDVGLVRRFARDSHWPERFLAVTSISIFMRGSARPAEIIIAAGRISPKYLRSVGQVCSNSAAFGST